MDDVAAIGQPCEVSKTLDALLTFGNLIDHDTIMLANVITAPFSQPRFQMTTLTANELRIRGIAGIERMLQDKQEVIISVRGRPRYVVMDSTRYEHLRECETMAAWAQTWEDLAAGRCWRESADAHSARIHTDLAGAP